MSNTQKITLIGILLVGIIALGVSYFLASYPKQGNAQGGRVADTCVPTTAANVTIGTTTGNILSTSTLRAWARIRRVENIAAIGTSTPFLSFNRGASAVQDTGVALGTTTPYIDFGRNTDFPYIGTVTGINKNVLGLVSGSTTVEVTECLYPN